MVIAHPLEVLMKTFLPFLAAAAALTLTPAAPQAQSKGSGKMHVRHIFVSVTDGKGGAVEGLAAADFTVSEDGQPRGGAKAGAATGPEPLAPVLGPRDAATPAPTALAAGAL